MRDLAVALVPEPSGTPVVTTPRDVPDAAPADAASGCGAVGDAGSAAAGAVDVGPVAASHAKRSSISISHAAASASASRARSAERRASSGEWSASSMPERRKRTGAL